MNNIILELNDVNLSNFLELEENKIIIEILNMTDGNEVCTIIIENIISLKYTNEIDNNDILPTYIGELTILQNPLTNNFNIEMLGWIESYIEAKNCTIRYI